MPLRESQAFYVSAKSRSLINLVLISLSNLFGGLSLSLLAPFYSAEALLKGVSVTKSGFVLGSVFVMTVLCTPLIGRYIEVLGARRFLLFGSAVTALGNSVFGALYLVEEGTLFFLLSILVRVITAVGESALPIAAMALASRQVTSANEGKAVAACETCFGVGTVLGPSVGGLLYDLGGFCLPFWVAGGAQFFLLLLTAVFLKDSPDTYTSLDTEEKGEVTWGNLLRAPGVLASFLALCFTGTAWTWCFASLQPYLYTTYGFTSAYTGLAFMMFGLTYTFFTPVFGWMIDRGLDGFTAMLLGICVISVSMAFLAPAPPLLEAVGHRPWLLMLCMAVQGVGTSAAYLGSLIYMLK